MATENTSGQYEIGTRCLTGGYTATSGQPRQIPIIQSTTFKYDTSEQLGDLFDLKEAGYFYSRLQNPTCDNVAARICNLEGGSAAMLTSSGQAANFLAVLNIATAGDHVISSASIYGGTFNLFAATMAKMGIEFTFISPKSTAEEIQAAFRPNTKLIFGETLANPALTVLDIEKFASVAHANGVPLIVDNTFPTPILCNPIKWGADVVTHSTTKYMDGHGGAIGGAIIDSGNFDWMANAEKFPGLCTPDDTYHGIVYANTFGQEGAYITKATVQLMRDLGVCQAPQNAFYLAIGLESLHLRMKEHAKNGLAVAEFLENHPAITWVNYPGLESSSQRSLAAKYLPNGCSGVVSFGVKGGREAAGKFMAALGLIQIATHVADARSCILHPANSTHRQLNDDQLEACGVKPDMIRLSCGIEDGRDLIKDIENALNEI